MTFLPSLPGGDESKSFRIRFSDVRREQTLLSWGLAIFVVPLSGFIAVLICNHTRITPNQITSGALTLRMAAAACFVTGRKEWLIVGAFCYYFSALLDAIDGPVARLTGRTSPFGRYFDHGSDLIGDISVLAALAYGQGMLNTPMVLAMIFMHLAESYVSYLTNAVIACSEQSKEVSSSLIRIFEPYLAYRKFFFSRNLKTFFSFPDYSMLVFVALPLAGLPQSGIVWGFYFLFLSCLYTIFSTFVSIHTGRKQFP